ncbi:hypothetical protein RJT34_11699 [Clitoria ternatea]|uniref:Uncharacterized protein n=1 Tax=Clitoria ternatea TaxID=43366 RepID=A0AAN9JKZ8_CLITE
MSRQSGANKLSKYSVWSGAVQQIKHRNSDVELNLRGIHPFYEFHGERLFSIVDGRYEEPTDVSCELAPFPKGQSLTPRQVSSEHEEREKEGREGGETKKPIKTDVAGEPVVTQGEENQKEDDEDAPPT